MRIFVHEFITGGGLVDQPLPPSLAREGELMARALVRDLQDVPGVEVVAMREPRAAALPPTVEVHVPRSASEADRVFAECVDSSDATWIVAPETDGVLERLSCAVLARGRCLLGSRPPAIAVAASKTRTAAALTRRGVPTVPVFHPAGGALQSFAGPAVLKPDDGAGCIDTRVYPDLGIALGDWEARGRDPRVVVQPCVGGEAASLCLLVRDGRAGILAVNRQHVAQEHGLFRFLGCCVNALAAWQVSLADLGEGIAKALPGLWGYVGVDLILTERGAQVLEVNPRLTTSYVGLRDSIGVNPAAYVLGLLDADAPLPASPPALRSVEVSVESTRVDA
jgi:predicted ATP-grasp superfamily ATP-dependent carboligase